jgi:hypothetical protein
VAEVFRDLSLLKLTKDLSFGERKLYDTAQNLLVKELSTAKNKKEKAIIKEIDALFKSEEPELLNPFVSCPTTCSPFLSGWTAFKGGNPPGHPGRFRG